MIRFDDRRVKQKDGDDFRDFAGEFLRVVPGYGQPTPRDSGSVDGCIDLYCEKEGVVVECKFVSCTVKDESARVDAEWKEVRKKLDENLVAQEGRAAPRRAPFLPWANVQRPIRKYVFVTSARLANEAKRQILEDEMRQFFCDDIAKRPGYEHLQNVVIDLIDWTSIVARITDRPSLIFKWLKQWPSGFAELDDRSPVGFRAFLSSERLPYLSRDCWTSSDGLRHSWTETSLAEEMARESADPVVVFIGQGGVGKTRLGLECARRMRKLGWWTIRCNGLLATTTGLRSLLEQSPTSARVLLFVDYLETWPSCEAFANEVVELNQSSGHLVRIIATCRASYRERLPSFMKTRNVGGDSPVDVSYSEAVTRHILRKVGTTNVEMLAEKCRHNFALAAFLAYLQQEKPETFAAELSDLREEPSFEAWIIRRFQNAGVPDLAAASAILAACEFETEAFDKLAEAHGANPETLRKILAGDKWIERRSINESGFEGPVWAAFHDIFADVVLNRALEVAPDRDDFLDRLLGRAVVNGVLRQTLSALGRIRQSKMLVDIDWRSRIVELERRQPGTLASHAALLMSNPLLTPEVRLDVIAASASLREMLLRDAACDVGVVLAGAALKSISLPIEKQVSFDQFVLPLIDVAVGRSRQSNLVLRLAFNCRPERYRAAVLQSISDCPRLFQTHYLLKVWLDDAKGHSPVARIRDLVSEIEDSVFVWLEGATNTSTYGAQFIYRSWLNAAAEIGGPYAVGMVARIESHIFDWFDKVDFAKSENARFLYSPWLEAAASIKGQKASDMVARIEGHLNEWLSTGDRATTKNANFIYQSWLDAAAAIGGDRARNARLQLEPNVLAWVAKEDNRSSEDAEFVFSSWLNLAAVIGGPSAVSMIKLVEDDVAAWLSPDRHAASPKASFVLRYWFQAAAAVGGDQAERMVARFEPSIVSWFDHGHASTDAALYVFDGWLKAATAIGGQQCTRMLSLIETYAASWLCRDGRVTQDSTALLYKKWLEAAEDQQLRRFFDETLEWILANQDGDKCDFVLESWLDRHLPFDLVAEPCFRAVRRLQNEPDAAFVLKHVVRQKKLPKEVIVSALGWCARFPDHEDVLHRVGPLVTIDRAEIVGPDQVTRTVAKVLYHLNLDAVLRDSFALGAARATLANLYRLSDIFPKAEKLARIYFVRWMRDGRIFCPLEEYSEGRYPLIDQKLELVEALFTPMSHGDFLLENPEDRIILERFCRWVAQWDARHDNAMSRLVEELSARFGAPQLWQLMRDKASRAAQ